MEDGKRARPRWWSRPQGQPPAGGTTPPGPSPAGGGTPPDAPAPPPERPSGVPRNGEHPPDGHGDPRTAATAEQGAARRPPAGPAPGGRGRRPSRRVVGTLAVALAAGVVGGLAGAAMEGGGTRTDVSLPQVPGGNTGRAPGTIAAIAQATLPGVVYIHVKAGGVEATGTGIVLDTAGHILTNNHVVLPAVAGGTVDVTLNGGGTHRAAISGRDAGYDLAVVKIDGVSGLKPLALGNSSAVRVGDPVIAIGAPYDLEGTVTAGIVSAKDRAITAAGDGGGSDVSYVDAIQTDAPINPGNSGGPLMNGSGQVIGVNSAIRSDTAAGGQGGSIGLGFAIPINEARRVAQQLINGGRATHPVIGVTVDMNYNGGAKIADKGPKGTAAVTPNGPGAQAGLRAGDVITAIDGAPVHSGEELIVRARSHQPGDRVSLTVRRAGRTVTVRLVLGSSSSAGG